MTSVFDVEIIESAEELKALLSDQTLARFRDRVRALYLRKIGIAQTRRQLAALLGCNESTIYRWFCTYQSEGMSGLLQIKTSPGKPSLLPPEVLEELRQRLQERSGFGSYGEIQQWLAQQYDVQVAYATVHGIVRYKLQSKLKVPRPMSIEADPQVQDTFKKKLPDIVQVIAKYLGQGRPIRYFCEDESRFGLKTLISRVITLCGVKPLAQLQWLRSNFWLYGAVEPTTGAHFFYAFSHLDAACFQRFVDLFAVAFPDSLNLLHLDQASCHTAKELVWPENVIPIFQPAHSPELNPIERLCQELKKHFKGKNFDNLVALRDEVFELINSLNSAAIMSLTGWSYIIDALDKLVINSA